LLLRGSFKKRIKQKGCRLDKNFETG